MDRDWPQEVKAKVNSAWAKFISSDIAHKRLILIVVVIAAIVLVVMSINIVDVVRLK